ncbi:MAG: response regulator [Legionellaceae bacterium]|nr:response regulator [Legionellaceae bacterium]
MIKTKDLMIYIVDDDPQIRDSLRYLFESVHYQVETYHTAQAFLENYPPSKQGCFIIDVRMPIMSGLDLLEQLNLRDNRLPVVIMTGYGNIGMAVRAMKLGAIDFVLKPFNDQCLLEIVQKCIVRPVDYDTNEHIHARIKSLSMREREVLDLILEGKLNKEVAYELSISISTVEVHRANIMRKMQAKTLAQLIKFYFQSQLVT